jgi:PPP family 3-phenylpropionic acid transporter
MIVFSFFWNASLPQFEATTMSHLGTEPHRYSGIRLWGSIGFIVTVACLGPLLGAFGTKLLPVVVLLLFSLIWLSSLAVPETAAGHLPIDQVPLRQVLKQPVVLAMLAICFLVQASHGPYYAFFSLYLGDYGYSTTVIGQLWALGVIAEIGVFLLMPKLLPRYGARKLLLYAVGLTAVRWLLTAGFADNITVITLAQTLHAASFGLHHAVMIYLFHALFTGVHQGRGQGLYSSVSFGAGGALGSLVSGYLWHGVGPEFMYLLAAVAALAAMLVVHLGIPENPVAASE